MIGRKVSWGHITFTTTPVYCPNNTKSLEYMTCTVALNTVACQMNRAQHSTEVLAYITSGSA